MRRALLLAALLAGGCAHARAVTPAGPKAPEVEQTTADQVLRVIGRWGMAHACPVETDAGRFLVTNAHVVDEYPESPTAGLFSLIWSDGAGHEGIARPVDADRARDLALLRVASGEVAKWYPVASTAPAAGDRLSLLAYKWKGRDHVLEDRRVVARVLRVVAGHVVYAPQGLEFGDMQGGSGGCGITSDGKAASIHGWSIPAGPGEFASVGVGIWGDWLTRMVVAK